jgi:TolA-binding protein
MRRTHRPPSTIRCMAIVVAVSLGGSPVLAQSDGVWIGEQPPEDDIVAPSSETRTDAEPAPAPVVEVPKRPPAALMSDATGGDRLDALRDLVERYEQEANDFRDEIRVIADRKYRERRRQIEDHYSKQLDPVIARERANRLDAIAAFEGFLKKHPSDPKYTPDALFRLAELYFEKYDDEYQVEIRTFKETYDAWVQAGSQGDPPEEPKQHFERTIALYQQLITQFPNYPLLDGAYYLLGYTLRAQGESEEGLKAWQTLVNRYPSSRFYSEVWFRIGDHHFDEEQWPDALNAFLKVVPLTDSQFYDKALYKLAWTYYLVNEFDKSVTRFFELLDFSYKKRADESNARRKDKAGSVLEEESVQYVAISFADDNWRRPDDYKNLISGDSLQDEFAEVEIDYVRFAMDYFRKLPGDVDAAGAKRPYQREIIAKLGDILFKQSKNKQAILALSEAIKLDPMHRDAPKLQDLIVQAWERERAFDQASVARDVLVQTYGRQTEWAKTQLKRNDSRALKEAEDLARVSLYKAAIYYHQQAQKYFESQDDDEKLRLGVESFKAASVAYKEYLALYPHDKEAYELTFYLADTYYYSLNFVDAAASYRKVRDSSLGKKYKKDAAIAVVFSLDKVIEAAIKDGSLPEKDIFSPNTAEAAASGTEPEALPPLRTEYIAAIDEMLLVGFDHPQAPAFAYRAGAILYSYKHYEPAIARFEKIIELYPSDEAARFAANFVLDYLLAKKDWAKAAQYAAKFQQTIKDDSGTFAKIEGGARFQIAKKKLEDGELAMSEDRISEGLALLEEGANAYLELLAEDPKREFADVMMYNAALSLEKARRPLRAASLYERLYKEYPESQYSAEAMFRVASKSEQSFNFDKAVTTYLALVKAYPESERRSDAQINAALALEGQQKYERAAEEFERYATLFPEKEEAPSVFFRAAMVHKKRGDTADEMKTLNRFIQRYKSDANQVPRIVEAHVRIGDIYKDRARAAKGADKKKNNDNAVSAWKSAVSEFQRAKGSSTAAYFGGKAAFNLSEEQFEQYRAMKIQAMTGKKQGEELIAKTKRLTEVEAVYKGVITNYKQAEWTLASLYRIGSLYDSLQRTMFEAPCPTDIKKIDEIACDEYRTALEERAYAVEEKAIEAYRVAYDRSRELKITNEWTKKTLESLNLLRASEYPIDKTPLANPTRSNEIYRLGLVLPDGGAQELKAIGPVGVLAPGGAAAETPPAGPSSGGASDGAPSAGASDAKPPATTADAETAGGDK